MKIESGSLGATCTTTMSYAAARGRRTTPESATGKRLRSIPMTGVTPEPAVTKRNLPPSVGSTNSPWACSRWTSVPGRDSRTRWVLTSPSGTALTVMEMWPSGRGPWVRE